MKRYCCCVLFVLLVPGIVLSQAVGLVLSGGGAKGLVHIGVIKALEENGIPIDYVAGTSMGAIVGAMYAAGYTTEQMAELVSSEDFRAWSQGIVNKRYRYYFKKDEADATMFSLDVSVKDSIARPVLPTNVISTTPMDFAFMEMLSGPSAAAAYDFDRLMVPFRCVATDIYMNREVVFRNGYMGDAVRASMTYPFYFRPITVENMVLFDGGMLNNFPVDVMEKEFTPGYIIGSKAAMNAPMPTEEDVLLQLENMLLGRTDYSIPEGKGWLIESPTEDIGIFDFSDPAETIRRGYDAACGKMEIIKEGIARRISPDEIAVKRNKFKEKIPVLEFGDIQFSGIKPAQEDYIKNSIWKKETIIGIDELRENYFRLIADEMISTVYPKAKYDSSNHCYTLHLDVRIADQLGVKIGGNIASSSINQGFAAVEYRNLGYTATKVSAGAYYGRLYSSAQLKVRFDYPTATPFFMQYSATLNRWDFFSSSTDPFFEDVRPSYIIQDEGNMRIDFGMPFRIVNAFKFGTAIGRMNDEYFQVQRFSRSDTSDRSRYDYFTLYTTFERSTQEEIQYPVSGEKTGISLRLTGGQESYMPGSQSFFQEQFDQAFFWMGIRAEWSKYYSISERFNLGCSAHMYLSNKKLLSNYMATILNAPKFYPFPHSKTLFLENYAAHQYFSAGIIPVFRLRRNLHLRNDAYLFIPWKKIGYETDNDFKRVKYEEPLTKAYLINSTALVYHTVAGPIALSLNYYNKTEKKWYLLFNFGFILFNQRGID
jgi:NTE family protein